MPDELKSHLDAVHRWIEEIGSRPIPRAPGPGEGLSRDEKQQLLKISHLIEQLKKVGVEVPSDLRNLKLSLSAKDLGVTAADPVLSEALQQMEDLIGRLREVLRFAREVRDRLKPVAAGSGTKKHFGVSLEELLDSGLLSTEDQLELQWARDGERYAGKVLSDGTVSARTEEGWKTFVSLSAVAADISGRSQNGWEHWRRINSDGTRTSLKQIRTEYLAQGGDS